MFSAIIYLLDMSYVSTPVLSGKNGAARRTQFQKGNKNYV